MAWHWGQLSDFCRLLLQYFALHWYVYLLSLGLFTGEPILIPELAMTTSVSPTDQVTRFVCFFYQFLYSYPKWRRIGANLRTLNLFFVCIFVSPSLWRDFWIPFSCPLYLNVDLRNWDALKCKIGQHLLKFCSMTRKCPELLSSKCHSNFKWLCVHLIR